MDVHEDLALDAEREPNLVLRQDFAAAYRDLIGVAPERRHELRTVLQAIRNGASARVATVLQRFR